MAKAFLTCYIVKRRSQDEGKPITTKRQADNHHVKRRSQDEDYLFLKSDWYGPFQVLKSDWDPGPIEEVKHQEEDGPIKFQVLKSGCDMDYTDESEMKCDSEGLNAAKGSNE